MIQLTTNCERGDSAVIIVEETAAVPSIDLTNDDKISITPGSVISFCEENDVDSVNNAAHEEENQPQLESPTISVKSSQDSVDTEESWTALKAKRATNVDISQDLSQCSSKETSSPQITLVQMVHLVEKKNSL